MDFKAYFYDGCMSDSKRVNVQLLHQGMITVTEALFGKQIYCGPYSYFPPVGKNVFQIKLGNGSVLEAAYDESVVNALNKLSSPLMRLVYKVERNFALVLFFSIITIVSIFLFGFYGSSTFSTLARPLVPHRAKVIVGKNVLSFLDKVFLSESKLSAVKKSEIENIVKNVESKIALEEKIDLLFRKFRGKDMPNAVALLPKTIIVTDSLSMLLSDSEIESVIAHEFGHLVHDDGTKMLLHESFLSLLSVMTLGSSSGVVNGFGKAIISSNYSREQEELADKFVIEILGDSGGKALASALKKMTASDTSEYEDSFTNLFSSHPLTEERIKYLEAGGS